MGKLGKRMKKVIELYSVCGSGSHMSELLGGKYFPLFRVYTLVGAKDLQPETNMFLLFCFSFEVGLFSISLCG